MVKISAQDLASDDSQRADEFIDLNWLQHLGLKE